MKNKLWKNIQLCNKCNQYNETQDKCKLNKCIFDNNVECADDLIIDGNIEMNGNNGQKILSNVKCGGSIKIKSIIQK